MIEQLKSAIDQLHAAWHNYSNVHSALQKYMSEGGGARTYSFPPETTHLLETELDFLSLLPAKINQIEITLRRGRNYSCGLAPINALPPEILTRIFYFVLDHPCQFHQTNDAISWIDYPRFPDNLAQVCSLWRQTAISCPLLWHHIDLTLDDRLYQGLVDRANVYADRAGRLPIELHVAEEFNHNGQDYERLHHLLYCIAQRVETLEIVATGQFGRLHRTVFDGLFYDDDSNIKKLVLSSQADHQNILIFPAPLDLYQLDNRLRHFGLNISESRFTRGFSTITVLHARGIFPSCVTTAYHGLVDLRLLSTSRSSHIEEADIRSILESSPGLRILHFGLEIQNPTLEAENVTPVFLQDLEVVRVFSAGRVCQQLPFSDIIRLLAPGQKPLRLSLEDQYTYRLPDNLSAELHRFFARANVVQIHIQRVIVPLHALLRQPAHLECVVLSNLDAQLRHDIRSSLTKTDEPDSLKRLNSLRVRSSCLSQSDLRLLLSYCPSGIVLDECDIYHDESGAQGTKLSKQELFAGFPEVKVALDAIGDPMADWDILD